VGGGPGGLEAAALVDGDVDDDRALPHEREHLLGDELGRLGAGDEHAADDEVRRPARLADVVLVAVDGADVGRQNFVQLTEPGQVDVHDRDSGSEACSNFGGLGADDSASEHQDFCRFDARHAAKKNASTTHWFFEIFGSCERCVSDTQLVTFKELF
jgi:hypothetical protein